MWFWSCGRMIFFLRNATPDGIGGHSVRLFFGCCLCHSVRLLQLIVIQWYCFIGLNCVLWRCRLLPAFQHQESWIGLGRVSLKKQTPLNTHYTVVEKHDQRLIRHHQIEWKTYWHVMYVCIIFYHAVWAVLLFIDAFSPPIVGPDQWQKCLTSPTTFPKIPHSFILIQPYQIPCCGGVLGGNLIANFKTVSLTDPPSTINIVHIVCRHGACKAKLSFLPTWVLHRRHVLNLAYFFLMGNSRNSIYLYLFNFGIVPRKNPMTSLTELTEKHPHQRWSIQQLMIMIRYAAGPWALNTTIDNWQV